MNIQDIEAMDEEIEAMEAMEASLARLQENRAARRHGFRSKGDYVIKTMERRYARGEFGEPPNFDLVGYNEALKQMIDEDMERLAKEESDTDAAHRLSRAPSKVIRTTASIIINIRDIYHTFV